jgi:metallo-beta-lactamase class B
MLTTLLLAAASATIVPPADLAPINCGSCAAWNAPQAPFRLHGDSWYVGTQGLSSVLVATPEGLVLIDGGLPQGAPLIAANIESLGFRLGDVRYLLNSHPHWDHAGGLAALQRLTGAPVVASPAAAAAMRRGNSPHGDSQAGFGEKANAYPPVRVIQTIADGGTLTLGGTTFTMHATPGHTAGGTTWTWRSCVGDDCRDLVFADSLSAVAAPGYRFSDHPEHVAELRASIARVAALSCDLVVSAHPSVSGLMEKLARREADPSHNALLDPQSCRRYAEGGASGLEKRLADEASPASP